MIRSSSFAAKSVSPAGQQVHASKRTISRDLLAAIERTHPLEAALAKLLIEEGAWALAD